MQKEPNLKQRVWLEVVNEIELGFEAGKGYELSAIRGRFNKLCPNDKVHNREIKVLLLNHFQDKITFTSPSAANKSVLVFSRSCEKETLAETIRSVDAVQICAEMIRDTLENHDFGLQDKFCDALDLERAWSDMEIPDPLLKFFSVLLNFNQESYSKVARTSCDCEDFQLEVDANAQNRKELSKNKCRKLKSLF